ncbi:MAG: antibiotic biosynthesis monooxygenase [Streptosporangiaceae bacterium]
MSAPVLVGYAGVLVAVVATGMLAGRSVRQPGIGFIVWTGAILGLAVALGAQSLGFARGFDQVTFRTVQLTALLLVPLWLASGLVEVAVGNDAVRFGTRLISAALAVVASVILVTDPLSGQPFSRAWPLTSVHFQPIARLALDVVQVAAVLVALVCVGLVLAGRGLRPPRMAVLPPGLAALMTAGLRFPFPDRAAYPLLSTAAAGLVLFGASRAGAGRRQAGERDGRLDGVHDDGGRYRPEDSFHDQRTGYPGPGRPGDLPGSRPGSGGDRGAPAAAPARPYGRIQIFTVLDDRVADFDRLAEETAEQVSTGEPDTLVYVIHLVPNAPMQRIFYEIYRDRAAFDSHESQPYMQRFAAERRSLVLATNVIELRLKYAKVAPLLNPQSAMPAGAQPPPPLSPQPQPQRSQPPSAPAGRGPQRPPGPAGDPRLQPPSPPRPQRPDQPRPDQPRPGQVPRPDQPRRPEPERSGRPGYDPERPERYEPRRPDPRPDPRADPRQVPSAGRRHGG